MTAAAAIGEGGVVCSVGRTRLVESSRVEGIERVGRRPVGVTAAGPAVDETRASTSGDGAGLADGLGEGGQLVVLGGHRESPLTTQHLPAPRDGDPSSVVVAQIPGMRLLRGRQRTDHRSRFGVDEGQGSHRGSGAAGSAAQTGKLHVTRLAPTVRNHGLDTLRTGAGGETETTVTS